jgi:hypothetical protein
MCMFSKPIKDIGKTRILVAALPAITSASCSADASDGKIPVHSGSPLRQLTVYSNEVMLPVDGSATAMILPFPVTSSTRCLDPLTCGLHVHNMPPTTSKLFKALESIPMKGMFEFMTFGSVRPRPKLSVHRSGSYRYSVVPTVADFNSLDSDIFKLTSDSELYSILARHYDTGDFAFLVCIIDDSATMVPFAYEHDRLASGQLFVPTRHYHSAPPLEYALNPFARTTGYAEEDYGSVKESKAEWDHKIFSIGSAPPGKDSGNVESRQWCWYNASATGPLTASDVSAHLRANGVDGLPFMLPPMDGSCMYMVPLLGKKPNEDIILDVPLLSLPSSPMTSSG